MIASHRFRSATRGGFTLVEMLTVIVIISILAGLVVGGAIAARRAARRAVIKSEISQLDIALEDYKNEVGEYPPDFAFCDEATSARGIAAQNRVLIHMRKRFPRLRLSTWSDFTTACGTAAGPGANQLNPSTALAFWLGGPPNDEGKPSGFSKDPSNPFKSGEPRGRVYYDFDTTRMNGYQLNQPKIQPVSPYVYFRAIKSNDSGNFEYGAASDAGAFEPFSYGASANVCVPYLEDAYDADPTVPVNATDHTKPQRTWRAPQKYQIIAAGLDGQFSDASGSLFRFSKIGEGFTDADYDNLTSFAEGELENEL